jgi:secondary thiamine-phosphate synthase enzyme
MKTRRETLTITTRGEFDIVDITSDVEKAIVNAEIQEGFALVYSPHTTCGVMVNEKEKGLLADMRKTLSRLIPQEDGYLHDDFSVRTENLHPGETKNAHAHLRHLIGGKASEFIPVQNASLLLGKWQRVMVVEFDREREREILIQVCGV